MHHLLPLRRLRTKACKVGCAVVATTLVCGILAILATPQPARAAECPGSLQAKIDAAPAGATVRAEACVYREQLEITKPLTLLGQPGSEIRGSEVWDDWRRLPNGAFRSSEALPDFRQEDVSCDRGTQRCAWPEQVFVNGVAQQQVVPNSNPVAGQFKIKANRRIVLGSNPKGKVVEVTTRRHWVTGSYSADRVTISGFTMAHAANEWRSGAIQSRPPTTENTDGTYAWGRLKADGDGWIVRDNVLSHAHGAVVSVRGRGSQISGNEISYGGQLGVHNPGDYSLLADNRIHHNNTERFCIASGDCAGYSTDGDSTVSPTLVESGGVKIAGWKTGVTVNSNSIYDNRGQGLWFDVQTRDVTATNNRVHHNARRGIFFEISDGAKILGNVVWENGWATPSYVDGAGIQIGNSSNVEVANNTLAWNADGIAVVGLDREGTANDAVTNVHVHDNTIFQEDTNVSDDSKTVALGWIQGWTDQMFASSSNNMGENNRYYYPTPEGKMRYEWDRARYSSLAALNAVPGEEDGRYLTKSEKDTVATDKGVPAHPDETR